MSLINDALKRTDTEKRGTPVPAFDYSGLNPIEQDNRTRKSFLLPILLIAAVAIAGSVAWIFLGNGLSPKLPEQASAAMATEAQRAKVEAQQTLAKTVASLKYYHPPTPSVDIRTIEQSKTPPAFASTSVASPNTEQDPSPSVTAKTSTKPAKSKSVPTTSPTNTSHVPPTSPGPATEPAQKLQSKPVHAVVKPRLSPGSFKLSAIMHGPGGATAIINGRFMQAGSTIDGAKVIRINKHTVELETDGEKLTIQM